VFSINGRKGRAGGRVVCFAFSNGPETGENRLLLYPAFEYSKKEQHDIVSAMAGRSMSQVFQPYAWMNCPRSLALNVYI
jgi:hypothetical protein